MIRSHAERNKTPRALHCEFPLGRPLGKPRDVAFQHRVLKEVFALLDAEEGPVLRDFSETIDDSSAQPLSCKLPPRANDDKHPAVAEALGLKNAYDRARANYGRTNVGRLIDDASEIPGLLEGMIRIVEGTPWDKAGLPENEVLEASKDIMSYYEEAATELAEHVPEARAAESWFYRETQAGELLLDVCKKLLEEKVAWAFLVAPYTQWRDPAKP